MGRNYRKIWSNAYGIIPKDSQGRSYEIHHLNGNHDDNRLENLTLVTIQEHYDIHFAQSDWQACFYIAKRMKLSPAELGAISSELQNRRVADGTHNLLDKEAARARAQLRVKTNTHNWQDSQIATERNNKLIAEGRHIFLNSEHQKKASAVSNRKVMSAEDGKITTWAKRKSHENKTQRQHTWIELQ